MNPHADLYPTPQEGAVARTSSEETQNSSPTSPSNSPAPVSSAPQPKKNNTLKIVLLIIGGCLIAAVIIFALLGGMVFAGLNGAKTKAKDAKVKADISSARAAAEIWFSDHDTYEGFAIDSQFVSDVSDNGSQLYVQGLSKNTYAIFAGLSSNNKLYCADASGAGVELDSIDPGQTTCKQLKY